VLLQCDEIVIHLPENRRQVRVFHAALHALYSLFSKLPTHRHHAYRHGDSP
jgi:hypothetical protein